MIHQCSNQHADQIGSFYKLQGLIATFETPGTDLENCGKLEGPKVISTQKLINMNKQ